MAVIDTPTGKMSVADPTGYEVIRGGQGYSTRYIEPGDIVTKRIYGGGRGSTAREGAERIAAAKAKATADAEKKRLDDERARKYLEDLNKQRAAKKEEAFKGTVKFQTSNVKPQTLSPAEKMKIQAIEVKAEREAKMYGTRRAGEIATQSFGELQTTPSTSQAQSFLIPGLITESKGTYSPFFGGFITESSAGAKGTAIITPATPSQTEQIKLGEMRGNALLSIPGQYLGTIFDKPISKELQEKAAEGNIFNRMLTFANPKFQYEVALEQEQARADIKEQKKISKKVETARIDLFASGIPKEELELGKIISPLTSSQESSLRKYNAVVNYASGDLSTIRLSQEKSSFIKLIATSDLTERQKFGISATTRVVQTAPYFIAPGRIILGADIAFEGIKSYSSAETKGEKWLVGGQVALGGLVAYSGVKGLPGMPKGLTITGSAAKLKAIKYATYAGGTALGIGVGAIDYYSTLKQTGSKSVALGAAVGRGGTILAGLYAPKAYEKAVDWYRTRNLQELKTPPLGSKPFIRKTPSGKKQLVFYERTKETKWYKPSTWKYSGNKPGQFFERQYRLVDPLVEAKMAGLQEVSYYDVVNGKVIKVLGQPTTFPTDIPSTHLKWFGGEKGGVQQYYVPNKFLPDYVKNIKNFGYSATGTSWVEGNPNIDAYQKYYSGKGVSAYFFRLGTGESSIQIGGSMDMSQQPTLYGGYFEKATRAKALSEVKVPSPLGGEAWKQYVIAGGTKPGVLYVPGFKAEVEGVVSGSRVQLGQQYFFKLFGRNIPIDTGAYFTEGSLSRLNVPSGNILTGAKAYPSSYIPTTSYVPSPLSYGVSGIISSSSFLKSYSSYKPSQPYSYSPIISRVSKSKPYNYKPYKYPTSTSYPRYKYKPYSYTPLTPYPYSPIIPRKPYHPFPTKFPIIPRFPGTKVSKAPPQRFIPHYIYQPSFTASALGITAKRIPAFGGALQLRPMVKGQRTIPKAPTLVAPIIRKKGFSIL